MFDTASPMCFVQVSDRDAARAYYGETLALACVASDAYGDEYALGGTARLRITAVEDFAASPHPVLGWRVENVGAVVRGLVDKGVRFEVYEGLGQDGDGIWTDPASGAQVAWFKDPFGNLLSVAS